MKRMILATLIFFLIGPYSSMRAYRSPPKSAPIKTGGLRDDGSTEYPSWVSGLGKEYPSWVEDLDHSTRHKKGVPRYYTVKYLHHADFKLRKP